MSMGCIWPWTHHYDPRLTHYVTHEQDGMHIQDSVPWEADSFWSQPSDNLNFAKGTGSGAQGVNTSSVTCCVTLGKLPHLSDVLFFSTGKMGKLMIPISQAVVWIQ